ncbi:hypothetical protein BDW22DRAFT_979761 [Trametopsis cervina]|nr:hypothetical protein BDW22DRAFT_979761 [Trametopsis cervina]
MRCIREEMLRGVWALCCGRLVAVAVLAGTDQDAERPMPLRCDASSSHASRFSLHPSATRNSSTDCSIKTPCVLMMKPICMLRTREHYDSLWRPWLGPVVPNSNPALRESCDLRSLATLNCATTAPTS